MEKKEKIVQRTFSKLDVDNSGYIDADELVRWMAWCPRLPCFAMPACYQWLAMRIAQHNGNVAEHRAG